MNEFVKLVYIARMCRCTPANRGVGGPLLLEQMLQCGPVTPKRLVVCLLHICNRKPHIEKKTLTYKKLVVCLLNFYKLSPISLDMESNEADHFNKEQNKYH